MMVELNPIARTPRRSPWFSLRLSTDSCGLWVVAQLAKLAGLWEYLQLGCPQPVLLSPARPSVHIPLWFQSLFPSTVEPIDLSSHHKALHSKIPEAWLYRCVCVCPAMTRKEVRPIFVKMFPWKNKNKKYWSVNEAAGSGTHPGLCKATWIPVLPQKCQGSSCPTVLAEMGLFVWSIPLSKEVVNTQRCVLGCRKSPLDDSHILYG